MTSTTITLHAGDVLTVTVAGAAPGPDPTPPPSNPPPTQTPGTLFDINTFNQRRIAMTWPIGGNTDLPATGPFGANDCIVLSFTTPDVASNDGRTKILAAVEQGISSFGCVRLMTLAEAPQIGGGLQWLYSQTPSIQMKVGGTPNGPYDKTNILKASTTYYVTMVNRLPPPNNGVSIATGNSGNMKVHFNN